MGPSDLARDADDWWHQLDEERRVSLFVWLGLGGVRHWPAPPPEQDALPGLGAS